MKLTDQLVSRRQRRPAAARPAPRAAGRPPPPTRSRDRVFAAAASAFAAHGFAGTSVDRIADAARLNKAMIYYHFHNKAELYREILRDMFGAVGARVRDVAASDRSPADKGPRLHRDVCRPRPRRGRTFRRSGSAKIADGGPHLDDATLGDMAGVLKALGAIIEEGVACRRVPADQPAARPCRHRRARCCCSLRPPASAAASSAPACAGVATITRDEVVAHVQRVTLGLLEGRDAEPRG